MSQIVVPLTGIENNIPERCMIPLPGYDYGDKKWGYRYVFKPSHDEYGFGTSVNPGVSASYKIISWMSADLTLMNGGI